VRVYVPAIVELHETADVPVAVRLPGEIGPQFKPAGEESVSVIVPENPFR